MTETHQKEVLSISDNDSPNQQQIQFTRIKSDPLQVFETDTFKDTQVFGNGEEINGKIFMHSDIFENLNSKMVFSNNAENGGYLLGSPFCQKGASNDEDDPDFKWVIKITNILPAEDFLSNHEQMIFTAETWSKARRKIDLNFRDLKIVGWYHTHLFSADVPFGLSELDQNFHKNFLNRPWQIAVLINISPNRQRHVRCYQKKHDGNLSETKFYSYMH